jgi:energy-coupling factor transporter ATP-binding protein EcfA2
MRIEQLSIRNLKLLDEINFKFEKGVSLLYGQNGVGKTTVLEAISLLGHLSTMRRIQVKKNDASVAVISHSAFFDALKKNAMAPITSGISVPSNSDAIEKFNRSETFVELADTLKASKGDLGVWFDTFKMTGSAIQFKLKVEGKEVLICVYKKEGEEGEMKEGESEEKCLSITQSLGRKKYDDLRMNETYALIFDGDVSPYVDVIIKNYIERCSYIIKSKTLSMPEETDIFFKLKDEYVDVQEAPVGFAFYLNTDLNDFGRMRDVRESVKDIDSDFVQEWINRFRIRFNKRAHIGCLEFEHKSDLEMMMNRIISKHSPFTFWRGVREFLSILLPIPMTSAPDKLLFALTECCIRDGKVILEAMREGYKKPTRLDYLSAGENECFFIFLYLLGTDIRNSICLLDEPDLHLAQFSKRPFFEILFALLREKNCQLIISTHSGFAYTSTDHIERFLIRRVSKPTPHFDTKWKKLFGLGMAAHYWRTAFGILGVAGGVQSAILVLLLFATGSYISDFMGAAGADVQLSSTHMAWTRRFTRTSVIIASILIYIQIIRTIWKGIVGSLGWKEQD